MHHFAHILLHALQGAVIISAFVWMMMLLIDYLNVRTRGNWGKLLKKSPRLQILAAALLGAVPGCMGTFTAVSLYTHRYIGFAALVAVMIASSGDEAFVMFAMIPGTAIWLILLLTATGILSAYAIKFSGIGKGLKPRFAYFDLHEEDLETALKPSGYKHKALIIRIAVALSLGVLLVLLALGKIGHEAWERYIVIGGSVTALFITFSVSDHFITHHIWGHLIRKHLLRIFLWTFGALMLIHWGIEHMALEQWISQNIAWVMLIAVLVGIIPESGPHLAFVSLFAEGYLPFSVLLASSIVQDGHGGIPLLAESQRSFVYVKLVNMAIGLIAGYGAWALGF
jgi:hypothetical protein